MKISNWSLVGYITGAILIAATIIRYFIVWLDYSQAFQFISIGILICAVSWLYNRNLQQDTEKKELEERQSHQTKRLEIKLDAVEDYLSELN